MSRFIIPTTVALGLLMGLAPLGVSAQRVVPQRASRSGDAGGEPAVAGGAPIVPKDHKCQTCGAPAVIAVAGDHGPVYYCGKHLPAGISVALPGQAPPPAAAHGPAVPAGAGSRAIGFPLGGGALLKGGNAEYAAGVAYGGARSDDGGDTRDRQGARDHTDSRDSRSTRDDRRNPRDPNRPR